MTDLLVLVPIASTLVTGIIAGLTKLALADRDARLKALEEDRDEHDDQINKLVTDLAVLRSESAQLLKEAEKTSKKLDHVLENLP